MRGYLVMFGYSTTCVMLSYYSFKRTSELPPFQQMIQQYIP